MDNNITPEPNEAHKHRLLHCRYPKTSLLMGVLFVILGIVWWQQATNDPQVITTPEPISIGAPTDTQSPVVVVPETTTTPIENTEVDEAGTIPMKTVTELVSMAQLRNDSPLKILYASIGPPNECQEPTWPMLGKNEHSFLQQLQNGILFSPQPLYFSLLLVDNQKTDYRISWYRDDPVENPYFAPGFATDKSVEDFVSTWQRIQGPTKLVPVTSCEKNTYLQITEPDLEIFGVEGTAPGPRKFVIFDGNTQVFEYAYYIGQ